MGKHGNGMMVTVRGRRWRLKRCRLPKGDLGHCDDPLSMDKEIRVCHTLSGREEMETIVHELFHAAHWDLSEEAVDEAAHDITETLWRLGYRIVG